MKRGFLWGILILAFLLRLINLSTIPTGFTPDEASFGYDAYSILKTGKDQWGTSFPILLKSFGDFKSPLYSYLSIPFIFTFGLSRFSIRLPNALLSTFSVYIVFLLTKGSFPKKKNLAYIASFLLAISPWHIMMSRGAFEANLTTFFLPLGIFLFIKGLKKKKYIAWSFLAFGLNLFTYHSAKVVTPIIVLLLSILHWKKIRRNRKQFGSGIVIFGILIFGLLYSFTLGGASRAKEISIFNGALEDAAKTRIELINNGANPTLARLLHNKYQISLKRFLNNYQQYFSLKFLFKDGPAEATYGMMPGRGVLYWFELPVLLVSMIYLIKKGYKEQSTLILLFWILVSPIPASLSMGRGYAGNRSVIMVPSIQIFLSLGIYSIYEYTKKKVKAKHIKKFLYVGMGIILFSFISFFRQYFVDSPFLIARDMLYGRGEMANLLKGYNDRQVIVSRRLSEPHIYIAFANHWNVKDYQKNSVNWDYKAEGVNWVDQIPEYSLGNYTFKNIEKEDLNSTNILVGKPEEFPDDIIPTKTIYYPNGGPAVVIYDSLIKQYAKTN